MLAVLTRSKLYCLKFPLGVLKNDKFAPVKYTKSYKTVIMLDTHLDQKVPT